MCLLLLLKQIKRAMPTYQKCELKTKLVWISTPLLCCSNPPGLVPYQRSMLVTVCPISVHGSCNKFAVIRKYILQNKISNLHVSQSFLIPDRKIRYQLKSPNLLWLAYLTQSIWRDGGPRHKWGQSTSAGRRAATRKLSLVVLGH